MLRVSVMLHPASGGAPREIAAVAIAQRGEAGDGRHRYVALTATDGLDDDPVRAAIVEHARELGVLELVRAVLGAADEATVDELVPELREALARKIFTDAL